MYCIDIFPYTMTGNGQHITLDYTDEEKDLGVKSPLQVYSKRVSSNMYMEHCFLAPWA